MFKNLRRLEDLKNTDLEDFEEYFERTKHVEISHFGKIRPLVFGISSNLGCFIPNS